MNSLQTDVDALSHGQHLCLAYDSDFEQQHVLQKFIAEGLCRDERVYYFAHRQSVDRVTERLRHAGIDTDTFCNVGRLSIHHSQESYLAIGAFDPDQLMQQWIEIIDRALAEGYAGLRVAADMSWALDGFPGAERLLDYEHRLTSFVFDGRPLIGLCEYDRNLFGDMATEQLIQAHEHGLVQPAGGLDGSQVRVLKSFEPPGVRVFGAITEGKRAAFESALRHVAHATSGDVMLDMSNVPEIDKAGVQAIVRVARELYVGRALVVRGVQPALAEVFAQFSHLQSLRMEMPAPDSAANIFRNLPET